jgi:UDP-N-acetylmuramate--alanine ligase
LKRSRLHFIGIGGQGISAVAQMALQAGDTVTGCDRVPSATTQALQQAGIAIHIGHSAEHLADVDTLVISPAVTAFDPANPEVQAARQQGLQVITWQELLGSLMRDKCVLSVCGVHGKGTTTSLLSLMLVDAGLDPTCEIGAVVPRFGTNYRMGQGQYFVNEADEFNHNFWHYHPRLAVVTSIEYEHPEFFANYASFLAAFEHFIRGMDMQSGWPLPATLLVNAGSAGCLELLARLQDWQGQVVTYALAGSSLLSRPADFEAIDMKLDGETSFRVKAYGPVTFPQEQEMRLQLPGAYNVENALAALVAARLVGVEPAVIVRTLAEFTGTRRRFEMRHQGPLQLAGDVRDVVLVDDYAHHPTAIAATLEATRRRYPNRRIVAVYQPHMYSRTQTFFAQFVQSFDAADVVVIADIFAARERDSGLVHAKDLVEALRRRACASQETTPGSGATSKDCFLRQDQVLYGGDVSTTALVLEKVLQSGDFVVIMGAGDIYKVTELLLDNGYQHITTAIERERNV